MNNLIIKTSDTEFEEHVLKSDIPVLVDFWAEWCGPCKMLSPILEDLAKDYQEKLKFVKLNVDDNTTIPSKYGIRGIPTLLLFKEGQVISSKVGALSKSQLAAFIDSNI